MSKTYKNVWYSTVPYFILKATCIRNSESSELRFVNAATDCYWGCWCSGSGSSPKRSTCTPHPRNGIWLLAEGNCTIFIAHYWTLSNSWLKQVQAPLSPLRIISVEISIWNEPTFLSNPLQILSLFQATEQDEFTRVHWRLVHKFVFLE
jgi:hypothetical protein